MKDEKKEKKKKEGGPTALYNLVGGGEGRGLESKIW